QVGVDPAEQRRVDETGADRADLDPASARLGAQRQAEPDYRVLGRVVGGQAGAGNQAGQRGRVDDVAAALGQHDRVHGVHAVGDTAQVDVDHPVPVLKGELLDQTADRDARVVEHVVDLPVL